ncbi:MAG: 4'-phosphopantetheinyl transferase superfamily protein [Chloroflexia bacterium]|nr:4'-phosphopantetheinyl transferase superfamily protein [Chloroflexia bacterium]
MHLFGKLLLRDALIQFGYQPEAALVIDHSKNDKPEFKNLEFEFNISHSGNYAICAASRNVKLGVDIEAIREINLSDFKSVFTANELGRIRDSLKPTNKFLNFWTRKESVIKADGRGMSIPLSEFEVIENLIEYDNNLWFIKRLDISDLYASHIALNKVDMQISYEEISYDR